jgi:hypothetical protein
MFQGTPVKQQSRKRNTYGKRDVLTLFEPAEDPDRTAFGSNGAFTGRATRFDTALVTAGLQRNTVPAMWLSSA